MPYAADGVISQDPISGGVNISAKQYQEALEGMQQGMEVTVGAGFRVAFPPIPEPVPPTEAELLAEKAYQELVWQETEQVIIANQLDALEEADAGGTPKDLRPGTRLQWLAYRGEVRNWVEGEGDFPDSSKRPARPN